MSDALRAVEELVGRVRAEAGEAADSASLKRTLELVLADLGIRPGDPAWSDGRDVVGMAYERLVPGSERRRLGQFFTPLWVGRVMARWIFEAPIELLVEPGCGSGSLLAAAAEERGERSTKFLGIDVDPLAIEMARATCAVRAIDNAEVRRQDFLLEDFDERPGGIVCNPPYTRHHALDTKTKTAIHDGFKSRLDLKFSKLSSLHVLFLVRALEVCADNARLAFVTPSHWLDMNYAREIKRLLLERAHVEAIIGFPARELLFDHAVTTATITLITRQSDGADGATQPTRLLQAARSDVDEVYASIADLERGERVSLTSKSKWSHALSIPRRGTPIEEVANVRRGVATGCNAFFVISDEARRDHGLSKSYLTACAASPKLFPRGEITTETLSGLSDTASRWLLTASNEWTYGPLADYLAFGLSEYDLLERHLIQQRVQAGRHWFAVETISAPILFSYFNRPHGRFVRNRASAIPLNNWLAITPKKGISADALFDVLKSPAVTERLTEQARLYGNGLWKLEPHDLRSVKLPPSVAKSLLG
ncbi:MAG: HsdM family class I SAM-dependent methyltransferase [Gaiellaceae bacterium]